jgi:type II secretory pathway pseudopilin PulG
VPYAPPRSKADPGLKIVYVILCAFCGCITLIALIGIVSTVAIPLQRSVRRDALQEKARNSLRAVVTAEFAYYAANGEYAANLQKLEPAYLSKEAASPGDGITLSLTGKGQHFLAAARLASSGRTYFATETGEIRQ